MRTRYCVIMKVGGNYVITDDQKSKEVDKWVDFFTNTPQAEEISIFERDKLKYKLIHKEHKRRIGF